MVSEATVKTHVARILSKLGLRDRVQVVVMAYESGFVQPGEAREVHGLSEDRRSLGDANGRLYPPRRWPSSWPTRRPLVGLVLILFAIGLIWEAFH